MTDRLDPSLERLDRSAFDLVFADDLTGTALDADRWIDHYLPHWTTPERSAARYAVDGSGLRLLIDADQPAWLPEDGEMRVSSIQTGTLSGPLGSPLGQMRHRDGLRVRNPQPTRRLWTPSGGLVEATMCASGDPTCMVAIWLVGFQESSPQESGEVCIAELFGDAIGPDRSQVRLGIKAHQDPRLHEEVTDLVLELDATQDHRYAAEWNAQRTRFYVDDHLVLAVDQGLDYPLQLMLDLFEFPTGTDRDPARYPKSAQIRDVRAYGPAR